MNIHTIGIDLGKTSFHVVGLNERGEVVVRKRFSRAQLLSFTANRKVHVIGMEACGGSHFLGRRRASTCRARSIPKCAALSVCKGSLGIAIERRCGRRDRAKSCYTIS